MNNEKRGLYEFNIVIVKQLGAHKIKIIQVACHRASFIESGTLEDDSKLYLLGDPKKKPTVSNTEKLDNNISRARTKVQELVLCNPWDYWCTFTISPEKYDRHNLKKYVDDFTEFIHNYNRRCTDADKVRYLFIPEQHKDGAWHMHGFIKGIRKKDLFRNKNGFLDWRQYSEKFGYISLDPIRDIERASSYALKYMSKDMGKTAVSLGSHLYYASRGLSTPKVLFRGHACLHATWDWEHPDGYCKIKTIDTNKIDLSEILEIST